MFNLILLQRPRSIVYVLKPKFTIAQQEFAIISNELREFHIHYSVKDRGWSIPVESFYFLNLTFFPSWRYQIQIARSVFLHNSSFYQNKIQELNLTYKPELLRDDLQLFEFQQNDVNNIYLKYSATANFGDMGTGKTLQAIITFQHLFDAGLIEKTIIFTRGTLCYNWKHEILLFAKGIIESDITIVSLNNKDDFFSLPAKILIVPYNLMTHTVCLPCPKVIEAGKKGETKFFSRKEECNCSAKHSMASHFGITKYMTILDESQAIMNNDSVTSMLMIRFFYESTYKQILTGTPIPRALEQIYTQMRFLSRSFIPMHYGHFKQYITKAVNDYGKVIEYDTVKFQDYMKGLKRYYARRMKSDIPEFSKTKTITPVYFQLDSKHRDLYVFLMTELLTKLAKDSDGILEVKTVDSKYAYLTQAVDYPPMLKDKISNPEVNKMLKGYKFADTPKVKYLEEFLDDKINNFNEKVVVVDWRPDVLEFLRGHFQKYIPLVMHGADDVPEKYKDRKEYRDDIINEFNNNPDKKLLLLSMKVGGVGLNLNKSCKTMIMFNLSTDTQEYIQVQDRIYRVNNKDDVVIYILVYDYTLDKARYRKNVKREDILRKFHKGDVMTKEAYNSLINGE